MPKALKLFALLAFVLILSLPLASQDSRYRPQGQQIPTPDCLVMKGAWAIGLAYPDRFSAIACIAVIREAPALVDALASATRKPPIIIFTGGKDSMASRESGKAMAEKAKALGYRVKYVEFPDADHWTVVHEAIQPMFDWFGR
jgi:acetyl esterase/lipase